MKMVPVSISVMRMVYILMIPLWYCTGGGCHITKMEVESKTEPVIIVGAAVGAMEVNLVAS